MMVIESGSQTVQVFTRSAKTNSFIRFIALSQLGQTRSLSTAAVTSESRFSISNGCIQKRASLVSSQIPISSKCFRKTSLKIIFQMCHLLTPDSALRMERLPLLLTTVQADELALATIPLR